MLGKKSYYFITLFVVLSFAILISRLYIVSSSDYVDGYDLKSIEANIKTKTDTLPSERGKIYDSHGNVLAETVFSYKIVAYVDPIRSVDSKTQAHVSDVNQTANVIASVVGESAENITSILNRAITNNQYQTYLGSKTDNITVNQRSMIEEYNLPGIEFEQKKSRSYPFGDFASYQVGYAKYYDENDDIKYKDGELVGELGVEKSFNNELTGVDGEHTYVADATGTKIPNTQENVVLPQNGNNIYLTIDKDIQLIVEDAVKKVDEKFSPKTMMLVVAEAKTGKILGFTSTPSFDPNTREIESYTNPLHELTIEPGSTMKTFTYATAIEEGVYDPNKVYDSSSYTIYDKTVYDWNKVGWGSITLHSGYMKSSNTGSSYIAHKLLADGQLHTYLDRLGFGRNVEFDLPGEVSGDVTKEYDIDVATASFGQGISITPIQMIQALTIFGTGGSTMKPYIVDKITDSEGNLVSKTEPEISNANVYSKGTVDYMRNMLHLYVSGPEAMNNKFTYPELGLIGKTGTSQIKNEQGGYLTGPNDYTYSFTGLMPKDDPEVIIYALSTQPEHGGNQATTELISKSIEGIAASLNISTLDEKEEIYSETSHIIDYVGLNINEALNRNLHNTKSEVIQIGTGSTVMDQYPQPGETIQSYSKIYFLTDGTQTLPDFTGRSYKDIAIVCDMLGIKLSVEGYGMAVVQSQPPGTDVSTIEELLVEFK